MNALPLSIIHDASHFVEYFYFKIKYKTHGEECLATFFRDLKSRNKQIIQNHFGRIKNEIFYQSTILSEEKQRQNYQHLDKFSHKS